MKNLKEKGWIRIWRQIEDNPLWLMESFTKGQAWVDLFLNANHKDNQISIRGNIIDVKRGQIAWSELTMAKRWKWSKNKVRRFLSYLSSKTIQQIEQQKLSKLTTIITILKYEEYQNDTTDDTTERQQKDYRRYTNNNDNNDNNDKKENIIKKEFAKEYTDDEMKEFAINEKLSMPKDTPGKLDFKPLHRWERWYIAKLKKCLPHHVKEVEDKILEYKENGTWKKSWAGKSTYGVILNWLPKHLEKIQYSPDEFYKQDIFENRPDWQDAHHKALKLFQEGKL